MVLWLPQIPFHLPLYLPSPLGQLDGESLIVLEAISLYLCLSQLLLDATYAHNLLLCFVVDNGMQSGTRGCPLVIIFIIKMRIDNFLSIVGV